MPEFGETMTALDRIVEVLGSKAAVARACEVKPQSLQNWRRIPAEYCRTLERACDGRITRYEMRPDVFGTGPDDEEMACAG